jgi:hypothetical protein
MERRGQTAQGQSWGAYGLRIVGLERPGSVLRPASPAWPLLSVRLVRADGGERRPADRAIGELRFDDAAADLWLSDREHLGLERGELVLTITTIAPLDDDALAHPFLGVPASVANRWIGRQVLHGGGCVGPGGGAWGLLGTKEAGKSSTLAAAHVVGASIVADDLLVLEGTDVCAGPATIDLREEAARRLGGERVVLNAGRERWRLRPAPVPATLPLAGFVELAWGDRVAVRDVPVDDRLRLIASSSVLGPDAIDATAFLELASLPMVRFERPPRIDQLETSVAQLLKALR